MAVTVARLQSVLTADTRDHDRALGRSESRMKSVGKVAGLAGVAIAGGIAVGLKSSVDAAQEAEKAQINLEQALRSANVSYAKHGEAIDAAIQKTSRLAAVDDEELSAAFSKLVRTTGDVTKATEGMNLATDISAARGISLEAATKMVERALNGNENAFKRVGLEMGKNASASETIAAAQEKFGGAAEAYGQSSEAATKRFGIAVENLQESIGRHLLPVMATLANKASEFIYWVEVNWPRFKTVVLNTWQQIKPTFDSLIGIIQVVAETVEKHWGTIERNFNNLRTVVESALKNVRDAIQLVNALLHGDWSEAWTNAKQIVGNTIEGIKALLMNSVDNILQLARALGRAVFNGFKEGVTGIGEFLLGVITGLKDMLVNQLENLKQKAVNLGDAIKDGIVAGVTGLGLAIWELIKAIPEFLLNKIKGVAQDWAGIGKAIAAAIVDGVGDLGDQIWDKIRDGITSLPRRIAGALPSRGDSSWSGLDKPGGGNFPVPTSGSANLMGALPIMAPFASAAASYGLTVTSGLRPGAYTKHGTLSDHAIGKALDVSNGVNTPQMAAFFRSLIGNPNVKQAFYDPLGSIFGGILSSYREGGHSDHVHVATYDRGGMLPTGWSIAGNFTGRPEPVGGGSAVFHVNVGGETLVSIVWDGIRRKAQVFERQNGRPAFGGGF